MIKKLLSLILLASLSLIFFSCTTIDTPRKTNISDDDLLLLSIYTFDGKGEESLGLANLGHAFLGVENISNETIKVGKYSLAPKETVTFGTWSIQAHFGVWYNVESVYIKTIDKYNGRVSVTAGLDLESVDKMNNFILSHDFWSPINNCSNFALNLWNTVAEENEQLIKPFIYTPSHIAKVLKKFENYEINKQIETGSQMFFFDDDTPKYFSMEV